MFSILTTFLIFEPSSTAQISAFTIPFLTKSLDFSMISSADNPIKRLHDGKSLMGTIDTTREFNSINKFEISKAAVLISMLSCF